MIYWELLKRFWPYVLGVALFISGYSYGHHAAAVAGKADLKDLQHGYDQFVANTKAQGEAAQKASDERTAKDKLDKEKADESYKTDLDRLTADNDRLRNQASRPVSSFLSAPQANSLRPDLTCYDRAEFDATLQQYVRQSRIGTTELLAEGDKATLDLNSSRQWAQNP